MTPSSPKYMQPYLWVVAHHLLENKLHVQSVKVSSREQLDYYSVNIQVGLCFMINHTDHLQVLNISDISD